MFGISDLKLDSCLLDVAKGHTFLKIYYFYRVAALSKKHTKVNITIEFKGIK